MTEIDNISKNKVNYSGPVDMKDFYEMLNGVYAELDYDVDELDHKIKHQKNGMLYSFIWDSVKNVDDYSRFRIWMKVHATGLKPVQVEVDGKKREMMEGDILIVFKGYIVTDYGGKWEGNPYLIFLKSFFDKYLYGRQGAPQLAKGVYKEWVSKCYTDVTDIIKECKAFLHMQK